MSFFGDVGSFEAFNLKGMVDQIKDNPARLLYGAGDPFSTKVWNGVLGKDDKPLVDQWGGAASQRYGEAEDAGINTGPGQTMHGIAKTIASLYAGGAAGGLLGGGASSSGSAGASTGGTGFGLGQQAVSGGMGNATYAGGTSSPGLLSSMGSSLSDFNTAAKPYMDAARYGQQASGLLSPGQQPAASGPAMQHATTGPQTLAQIAEGQPNPLIAQRQQYAQQRRAMRGY
jgi:hypothetical protein